MEAAGVPPRTQQQPQTRPDADRFGKRLVPGGPSGGGGGGSAGARDSRCPGAGVTSLEVGRACTEGVEEGRRGLEILSQSAVIAKAGKFKKERKPLAASQGLPGRRGVFG